MENVTTNGKNDEEKEDNVMLPFNEHFLYAYPRNNLMKGIKSCPVQITVLS